MSKKISDKYPVGQKIHFKSGNLIGESGTIIAVENESKHPIAIYGFLIHVQLNNGRLVFVEKTEHIEKANQHPQYNNQNQ